MVDMPCHATRQSKDLTWTALLIDFLRVAFHNILYIRSVYPSGIPHSIDHIALSSHIRIAYKRSLWRTIPVWCQNPSEQTPVFKRLHWHGPRRDPTQPPRCNLHITLIENESNAKKWQGRLRKIYLVILDKESVPIERFTVDVKMLLTGFDTEALSECVVLYIESVCTGN